MRYNVLRLRRQNGLRILFLPGWGHQLDESFAKLLGVVGDVLCLSFPFSDPTLEDEKALTINDYVQLLHEALDAVHFAPQLAIGHSFGGKILAFCPQIADSLLLVAPSSFRPTLLERTVTRYRIIRNKMAKRIYQVLSKPISARYLGSTDYQLCTGWRRQTFMAVKDAYPASLRGCDKIRLLGFADDSTISSKRLKKAARKNHLPLDLLPGGHLSLYQNPELFISYLKERYDLR